MSTKSLVITTRIPLSGDLIEEARIVTTAGVQVAAFKDALAAEFGADNFTMTVESATKRDPQTANGSSKPMGRPRKTAPNDAGQVAPQV